MLPLTPSIVSSICSAPLACDYLLEQSQLMIAFHQQQLSYWTSVKKELTRGAAHVAATASNHVPPLASPPASAGPEKKAAFMDGLASRLGAGPPHRSRATSFTEDDSPLSDMERSPASLNHASKPRMQKKARATRGTGSAFKAVGAGGGDGEERDASPLPGDSPSGAKGEEVKEEEAAYVAMPIAHAVNPVLEKGLDPAGKDDDRDASPRFEAKSITYAPVVMPTKSAAAPSVPKSLGSSTASPARSAPSSPSAVAMAAAARRPPPVPPMRLAGGTGSQPGSQPGSPSSKKPAVPPVPAFDPTAFTARSEALPAVTPAPSSASAAAHFQPRSLPTPPVKAAKLPPVASALPPPVPAQPAVPAPVEPSAAVTSSDEDYLAQAAPVDASGDSAAAPTPAIPESVRTESRLGAMGGFKLAGQEDLMAKLKKREPTEAAAAAAAPSTTAGTNGGTSTVEPSAGVVGGRSSGPTSPRMRMGAGGGSAAAPVPVVATVAACSTAGCRCNDFKQDKFKPLKCANCFHAH